MTGWTLRPAAPQDSDRLAACIDAAYDTYRAKITDLPDVSAGLAEDIQVHTVWVAERNGTIIGGVVLIQCDDYLMVANVAVDPSCKGQGLGRALMALAETECRDRGLTEMRLSTHVSMPQNVALYTHLGWDTYGQSGNKIHMRKHIA